MTIKEMHIGLDLALQKLNSNVFNKLLKEEKDYFLNITTQQLIRAALLDEKNTVFNIVTYSDIRAYYEALQYYIRKVELNVNFNEGYPYVYGNLPMNIKMGKMSSGILYKGISYKVITPGSPAIDFSDVGGSSSSTAGEIFECNPADLGTGDNVYKGETYRIINPSTEDFTTMGASSNLPGTVFIANTNDTIAGDTSTVLERLSYIPDWASSTGAEITPTSNFGYYNYLSSRSAVRYGQAISSGTLTKGKQYYVHVSGTTDLSSVGGKVVNSIGFIFTCTSDTIITWAGGTVLYEVIQPVNRIVKYQDIYNFLDHSYGTTSSSPLATIASNRIEVYHNYQFDVNRIYLDYIKEPVSVNFENSIDSDLPVSLHNVLVDTTAKYIQSTMQSNAAAQQPQQSQ